MGKRPADGWSQTTRSLSSKFSHRTFFHRLIKISASHKGSAFPPPETVQQNPLVNISSIFSMASAATSLSCPLHHGSSGVFLGEVCVCACLCACVCLGIVVVGGCVGSGGFGILLLAFQKCISMIETFQHPRETSILPSVTPLSLEELA